MSHYTTWDQQDINKLKALRAAGKPWYEVSQQLGRNQEACRFAWRRAMGDVKVQYRMQESPYPRYDSPLVAEGDALVLCDVEAPFHHAEFLNKVLDVAKKWKIKQVILAGDFLHFDSISAWEPSWSNVGSGPNLSEEMTVAREVVAVIEKLFRKVYYVIGNHEGRLLRAMQTSLFPADVLRLIDAQRWIIASYYYMKLLSNGQEYLIEHPKSASKSTASNLCSKYGCHVIMGHSHLLDHGWDRSGKFHAITAGHCVDEARLPYAAQRHTPGQAHALGAVIVRDGFPWLLHEGVDWKRLELCK